jgi:hypothetical protein
MIGEILGLVAVFISCAALLKIRLLELKIRELEGAENE